MQSFSPIFLLIFTIVNSIAAETYIVIVPTKIECNVNPKIMPHHFCELKPISRNRKIVNMWGNFSKPVYDFIVDVKLFKSTHNGWRPHLIKFKINFCDVLNGSKSHVVLKWVEPIIKKYSNLIHPCPYNEVYLKNLDPGIRNFFDTRGAFSVNGGYKLVVETHDANKTYIGRISFQMEMKEIHD